MADEKPHGGGFLSEMGLVIGGFILLVILWFANGGPAKSDLRGAFIHPLPPVGSGQAYGPQFGTSTYDYQNPNYQQSQNY